MHPLAARRARAHLLDCVGYLGVAAAMIPVGATIALTTELGSNVTYSYLVSAVPPAIASLIAARAESGPRRATWGKRRQGIEVAGLDGAPLDLSRALTRSIAKIFVPWQLGHMVAVGAAWGRFDDGDVLTYAASFAVYGLIGLYAWTTLRGSGRGVHDLLARSRVQLTAVSRA